MFTRKTILLSVIFLTAFNLIQFAQKTEIYGFHGIVKSGEIPIEKCAVKVFEQGNLTSYGKSLSNGYFKVGLNYGKKYRIEFVKDGYSSYYINISTVLSGAKSKLSSNIHTVRLTREKQAESYYTLDASGKMQASPPFETTGGSYSQSDLLTASAKDAKLKARLTADSIIRSALLEKERILKDLEKEKTQTDSLKNLISENMFKIGTDDIPAAASDGISEEQKEQIAEKDKQIKNLLSKGELKTEDSIHIIENIIEKKEIVLESVRKQLTEAELSNNPIKIAELKALLNKLEPELELIKKEAELYKKQVEKKNKEIALRNRQILMIGGIVLLLTVALSVLSLYYRQKKRNSVALMEKNTLLEQQKSEIHEQAEKLLDANAQISESNMVLQKQNKKIGEQNDQISKSINYASTIQQAVLPSDMLLKKHLEYFVMFRPKDVVSGDFYWFSELQDINRPDDVVNMLMLTVADCTGHGVPGAFMSLISTQLLNQIVNEDHVTDPAQVLSLLDQRIGIALKQAETGNNDGIDLGLVLIKQKTDNSFEITFSGAKRPVAVYRREKREAELIAGDRRSIGGNPKARSKTKPFTDKTFTLKAGDCIYLCSDGLADQNDKQREKFGRRNVSKFITENGHLPMQNQKQKLEKLLSEHQQDADQRDDISFMGISFFGKTS